MTDDLIKISKLPRIYKRTMPLTKELRRSSMEGKRKSFSIRVQQTENPGVEILPHVPCRQSGLSRIEMLQFTATSTYFSLCQWSNSGMSHQMCE